MQVTIRYLWRRLQQEKSFVDQLITRLVISSKLIQQQKDEVEYLRRCLTDMSNELDRLEGLVDLDKRSPVFTGPPRP